MKINLKEKAEKSKQSFLIGDFLIKKFSKLLRIKSHFSTKLLSIS